MKKIVIALLLICIASNAYGYSYETDENSRNYGEAIEKVAAFGIMHGYEDGSFGGDEIVKRSEAAVVVADMIKLDENNISDVFKDVPFSHWAKGYIEAAAAAGIVSGVSRGIFKPDIGITKYQAAVILLNAMGYGNIMDKSQSGGYEKFIADLKLYDGVSKKENDCITRAEFAQMICNALDKPLVMLKLSEGKSIYELDDKSTLLTEYLDIFETEGRVTANELTGLTGKTQVSSGMVLIDGEVYYTGGTQVWKKIGRKIKLYYRDTGDDKIIVFYTEIGGESVGINARDIVSFENNVLTYESSDSGKIRRKSEKIDETADVIFNGRYKIYDKKDFFPVSGTIELYDHDRNGSYDVVYINSYTTYIVESVNSNKRRIVDKYGKAPLEFKDGDFVNIELEGRKIGIEDISVGDVLSVAANEVSYDNGYPLIEGSSEIYDIRVSRTKAEGKVEAMEEEYITVSGGKYRISGAMIYENELGKAADVSLGLSAVFFIDAFGEAVGFERNTALPVEGSYGYAVDGEISRKNGWERVSLKIFDFKLQDISIMNCAKTVKIDGKTYKSAAEIYNALLLQYDGERTAEFASRLIVYKTDDEGLIKFIDTDYTSDKENPENSLVFERNQQTRMFANGVFGGDIALSDDSVVLSVPRTKASGKPAQITSGSQREYICNKDKSEYIYFRKPSFSANSTKYIVESYNMKDNGQAAVILYYYIPSSGTAVIGEDSSQTMIVDKVSGTLVNGEDGYEIRGFCGGKSSTLFLTASDSVVADMKLEEDGTVRSSQISPFSLCPGDVVKYSNLKQNSNITLRIERVLAAEKYNSYSEKYYTQADKNSTLERIEYFNAFNVAYGKIISCENGIIKVDFESTQRVYNISSVTANIYDKDTEKITAVDCTQLTKDTEVVIISANGTVKAVYAYDY